MEMLNLVSSAFSLPLSFILVTQFSNSLLGALCRASCKRRWSLGASLVSERVREKEGRGTGNPRRQQGFQRWAMCMLAEAVY